MISGKRIMLVVLAAAVLLAVAAAAVLRLQNPIESRMIAAIDRECINGGVCEIDLADVFAGFEWDTVSLFVAGNPMQIEEALGIYSDISDGIVFSRDGMPVKYDLSSYQFPADTLPMLSYWVERENPDDPYYVSLAREQAVVRGMKFRAGSGKMKYMISIDGEEKG